MTRRRTVGGSVLGLGLLVVTGATAPAALATPGPSDDTAAPDTQDAVTGVQGAVLEPTGTKDALPAASIEGFFGTGKSVPLQVGYAAGTAPADLSLAGAQFTLTSDDDRAVVSTCTTGDDGLCTVETLAPWSAEQIASTMRVLAGTDDEESNDLYLPSGTYTVTQTDAPRGLTPAEGTGTITLCPYFTSCGEEDFGTVVDDSLFSSPVRGTVVDAVTGAPISGAEYTLSGPAEDVYPADDDSTGDDSTGDDSTGDDSTGDDSTGGDPDDGIGNGSGDPTSDPTSAPTTAEPTAEPTAQPTMSTSPETTDTPTAEPTAEPTVEPTDSGDLTEAAPDVMLATERAAAVVPPARSSVTATSSSTGELVFPGWFLPSADYELTPGDAVAGYQADEPSIPVELGAPSAGQGGVLTPRRLNPVPAVVTTTTTPTSPTTALVPQQSGGAAAPSAAVARGTSSSNRSTTGAASGTTAASAAATPSAPTSVTSSAAVPPRSTATPPTVSPLAGEPQLQTEGSSMFDPMIVGLGLFFLVLVATGLGWIVRRRARAHG